MCSPSQPPPFLLFVAANADPCLIYVLHTIAQPLPVVVTVWTMGKVAHVTRHASHVTRHDYG